MKVVSLSTVDSGIECYNNAIRGISNGVENTIKNNIDSVIEQIDALIQDWHGEHAEKVIKDLQKKYEDLLGIDINTPMTNLNTLRNTKISYTKHVFYPKSI